LLPLDGDLAATAARGRRIDDAERACLLDIATADGAVRRWDCGHRDPGADADQGNGYAGNDR
jgi:hypothetical protein